MQKGKRLNREMAIVTYLFMVLFLVMAGYIMWFAVHDAEQVLKHPCNTRQAQMTKHVCQGSILSAVE